MKVQLKTNNKITLPQEVVEELGIDTGDDLLLEVIDGRLNLIPAMTVPRDEVYLFTPEWQDMIRDAEKNIRDGCVHEAASAKEMIKQLNEV